jgi:uncharacterized protein
MIKRLLSAAGTVCLFTILSMGQAGPPAASTAATKAEIHALFATMHLREQMHQVIESVVKQQSAMVRESMKKRFPKITEKELARFDSVMQETTKDVPIDGMLEDMVPIYQKYLTTADVKAMVVFYSSPTGKKLMHEMPAMTSEAMQASQTRLQAQMEKTMQRIDKMMREEGPTAPGNTPSSPSP